MNKEPEEGGECPECHEGEMYFPKVTGCSCHIHPPCSACVDNKLTCKSCGWEFDPPPPEHAYRYEGPGITGSYVKRPSVELGEGKRIFDFDYDSSSGSTMHYTGKCTPNVTPADILAYFGRGTFGHRGPHIHNGNFSFTKITD